MAGFVSESLGIRRMITYLEHDRIDKKRWDECIEHALNGQVYAWSWYLDIVHPGWEALVEVEGDKYLSVMPITCKRKYLIHYLCQPFFVQQLGVFSLHKLTPDDVTSFLQAIPKKYRLVEIRLNEGNPLPDGFKGKEIHRNHLLDLNHDYDLLLSNYHENTSRNLKRSLKYGLSLVPMNDLQTVIRLFREHRGASVSHWGDPEYACLERLATQAISSSNAFIYGVKHPDYNDVICGALFLVSHQRITFLFSGNSEVGKDCSAMTFLIDRVIAEYAARPLTLDFEGSDDPNLARFYQGFGSSMVVYPGYHRRLF